MEPLDFGLFCGVCDQMCFSVGAWCGWLLLLLRCQEVQTSQAVHSGPAGARKKKDRQSQLDCCLLLLLHHAPPTGRPPPTRPHRVTAASQLAS
jgi:hypothetical protein